MYYQYFGLREAPFSIAVNPRYLFMSARHRDALAHLLYGVGAGGGFILLTGEVGTGKTTINRCLLEQLPQDTDIAIILNPALNAMELLASACDELGIAYDTHNHSLKTLTDELHKYLLENHNRNRKTVLLIDEAQHLDFDVLEQIRLLTNLETNSEKLLQIILIGQPELSQMLARPELRQLNQRITARYNLEALNQAETGAYIHHRLQVAGMSPERVIFPAGLVRGIYRTTRGIPRVINVLCDRMLLGAYGRNQTSVDHSMLRLAATEVLGEEAKAKGPARWLAVGAAVLLLLLATWWLDLLPQWRDPGIAGKLPVATAVSTPSMPTSSVNQVAAAPPRESPSTPADVDRGISNSFRGDTAVVAPAPQRQARVSAVLLAPGEAMSRLWALYDQQPPPAETCPKFPRSGVACRQGQASTWNDLAGLNRPLALGMVTPQRFSAEVLLLATDGTMARVATGDGVTDIALAELAPLWSGDYRFLWRPPAGFEQPLALGDESDVVAAVAALFARLDGQSQPLATTLFNSELQLRVRLFQRRHGLVDDGVVGVQTLLKLNEQLGEDITGPQAISRLTSVDEAVQ